MRRLLIEIKAGQGPGGLGDEEEAVGVRPGVVGDLVMDRMGDSGPGQIVEFCGQDGLIEHDLYFGDRPITVLRRLTFGYRSLI